MVTGINNQGEAIQRYFFIPEFVKGIQEFFEKSQENILKPLFPLPQVGVSARLERYGMTMEEAMQAAALFKVEYSDSKNWFTLGNFFLVRSIVAQRTKVKSWKFR